MPGFDTSVKEDLVETLEDGKKGFGEAAENCVKKDNRHAFSRTSIIPAA